jgi:hypothetical protein
LLNQRVCLFPFDLLFNLAQRRWAAWVWEALRADRPVDRQAWAAAWAAAWVAAWAAWADRRLGLQAASAVAPLLATWVVRLQDRQGMVTAHHQVLAALLHQEATWVGLRHQVK